MMGCVRDFLGQEMFFGRGLKLRKGGAEGRIRAGVFFRAGPPLGVVFFVASPSYMW